MATKGTGSGGRDTVRERDPSLDLSRALAGIEPPAPSVELSAGFFHRTLARWLGLPEGKQPGRKKSDPPLWDYDFWKAELERDAVADDAAQGGVSWTARVYRQADGAPETYRYWVKLDNGGRIKTSGWIGPAPELVSDAVESVGTGGDPPTSPTALTTTQVERVFADDIDDPTTT